MEGRVCEILEAQDEGIETKGGRKEAEASSVILKFG